MKTLSHTLKAILAMVLPLLHNCQSYAQNTKFGTSALASNTTGTENSAFGYECLRLNTTGPNNTGIGYRVLYSNISGALNTANGHQSLFSNTSGTGNVADGAEALTYNTTGYYNTASGLSALFNNTTGYFNTAVGAVAMQNNTTGFQNTAVGEQALLSNTTGKNNTAIGYYTDVNTANLQNSTALGNRALLTASNQVRIGNSFIKSIGGYVDWTRISDARVKKNIKSNVPGLTFINKLKPITYNLNLAEADKIVQRLAAKTKDGKAPTISHEDIAERKAQERIVYTGFMAQDVEKAAKELNYDFSGVDVAENDKDLYGLRYADFVVPLVKAVQELSAKNDELQKQIDELKAMIVSGKQNQHAASGNKKETATFIKGFLAQNAPNPFNELTAIRYSLPKDFASAQIVIANNSGKILKKVDVSSTSGGILDIKAGELAAGTYVYSLMANGRLIDSKKMMVTK